MNRSGFTLIELMVAMAVFVVIALASGGVMLSASALSEQDEEFRIATLDAETVLETINGLPFDDIVSTYPDGAAVAYYSGLNLGQELVTVSYPDAAATNPLQATIRVAWKGTDGHAKAVTMRGLRVR